MGTGKDAVVDRELNVYGIRSSRGGCIHHAKITSEIQILTLMIAEKAADMILQNRR